MTTRLLNMRPASPLPALAEPTDSALLRLIALQDSQALSELHGRYRGRAFAAAYAVTRDVYAAEEAVQDAFMAVWRYGAAYNPRLGPVRPWFMAIVERRAIDLLRARLANPRQVALHEALWTPATDDVFLEAFESGRRQHVWEGVRQLPASQRAVIEHVYYDGMTFCEVAAITATPVGTVKSRARLAVRKLRRLLAAQGYGNGRPQPGLRRSAFAPHASAVRHHGRRRHVAQATARAPLTLAT